MILIIYGSRMTYDQHTTITTPDEPSSESATEDEYSAKSAMEDEFNAESAMDTD
jgi:hypothetical protein